jgi:glycosyltransferase involved in cell wall biosynthesis
VVAGETGYIAENDIEFVARVVELARHPEMRMRLGRAARERMAGISWDAAFEKTYAAYRHCASATAKTPAVPERAKAAQANAGSDPN